jgi:hypothetical protein
MAIVANHTAVMVINQSQRYIQTNRLLALPSSSYGQRTTGVILSPTAQLLCHTPPQLVSADKRSRLGVHTKNMGKKEKTSLQKKHNYYED